MREEAEPFDYDTELQQRTFSLLLGDMRTVTLDKPSVMGVINCSPNSFYNSFSKLPDAMNAAMAMVEAGVAFIDIGGEATNPKVDIAAEKPAIKEEIERIVPLIAQIRRRCPKVLISVDTSRPAVMRAAVAVGADLINDQRMLAEPDALATALELQVPVCLMHGFREKRQTLDVISPAHLLEKVAEDLEAAAGRCLAAGIQQNRIILDPGFGQGNQNKQAVENYYTKSLAENYYLLAHLNQLTTLGYPLLVGWSRKSMIGDVLNGAPADKRLYGSLACAVVAALNGAAILRVHDVAETMDAVKVLRAVLQYSDAL